MRRPLTAALIILGLTPTATAAHTSGQLPIARIGGFAALFLLLAAGLSAGLYVLLGRDITIPRPAASPSDIRPALQRAAEAVSAASDRLATTIDELRQRGAEEGPQEPHGHEQSRERGTADLDTLVRDTGKLADLLEQQETLPDRELIAEAVGQASDALMDDDYGRAHQHLQRIIQRLEEQ